MGEGAGVPRGRRRGEPGLRGPARPVRRGLASLLGDQNGRSLPSRRRTQSDVPLENG